MIKSKNPNVNESPIFEELSVLKVIRTPQDNLNIIHNDLSVSVIMPFDGLNNTSLSEHDFDMIFLKFQSLIDKIQDTNLSIQFVMTRTNDLKNTSSSHLPTFLRPRADYVKNLASNYQLFSNKFYLCLYYANTAKEKNKSFWNYVQEKVFDKETFTAEYVKDRANNLPDRISKLANFMNTFQNSLQQDPINLRLRKIDSEQEYWNILRSFTSPKKSRKGDLEINQDTESPKVALFSGVKSEIQKDHFVLDDYFHKVFMLDRAPKRLLYGKSIDIIESVNFELIYSLSFRVMSDKESSDTFKLRYFSEALKAGSNNDAIIRDKNKDYQLEKIDQNWESFVRGEGRGVSVNATLVLRVDNDYIIQNAADSGQTYAEYVRSLEEKLSSNVFSEFGGGEWSPEINTQWIIFNSIIPGCANLRNINLKDMMLSSHDVPYFLAMYDNQRPHVKHIGTNHYIDKRGNLFKFELKDPDLAAFNYLISGSTGSGKSVLINSLLTMQFSEKGNPPIICILDVGGDRGSYKKFMTLVKGEEINLSGPVKPTIQMFDLVPEMSKPTPEKIESLVKAICQKTGTEESDKLYSAIIAYFDELLLLGARNLTEYSKNELFGKHFGFEADEEFKKQFVLKMGECEPDSVKLDLIKAVFDIILSSNKKEIDGFRIFDEDMINEQLFNVYRILGKNESRYPKMTDVYNHLESFFKDRGEERSDNKILLQPNDQKLLSRLVNWTRKGQYPMFDKETDLNTEANVILADLKGLGSNEQLQQVYTLLISELFTNKMYFIRDRRRVMVRDEAWSLMKNAKARDYFVEDMRTARKNGFVTISASQSLMDYYNPDPAAGQAIIDNSQVQIFCKVQNPASAQEIGDRLGMPEDMQKELMNLGVQKFYTNGVASSAYGVFMMVATYNNKKNYYILKNLLHPFEYNLYSSSPEDNALIDFYLTKQTSKKFSDLEDVLWFITNGNHIGDRALYDYLVLIGEKNMADKVRGKNNWG